MADQHPENSTETAKLIKMKRSDSNTNLEIGILSGTQSQDQLSENNSSHGGTFSDLLTSDREVSEDEYIRKTLRTYQWYHGMMFGGVVEKLLKWDYSFLVRRAIGKTQKRMLCISTKLDDKIFHYQLVSSEEGWSCPKLFEKFPDIPNKKYEHISHLIDAWSLAAMIMSVPRKKLVVYHESITLDQKLGSGAFGEVFRANYLPEGVTFPIEAAVKRAIGDAKRMQIQEFCHEAQIMGILHHINIVKLYGIASLSHPLMLVMELVPGGDVKKFLKEKPHTSNTQILLFALDIARGMKHLAMKKVIHRDLAARNCLITKGLTVKISDFGLSVTGSEMVVKNLKKAPIRWLAPETLTKGIFNERTDVWSYGVLLTELMTRCHNDPLYPMDLKEVQKWIKESDHPHRVKEGQEPRELARLVDDCCCKVAGNRVTFATVKRRLTGICTKGVDPGVGPAGPELKLDHRLTEEKRSFLEKKKSKTGLSKKGKKDKTGKSQRRKDKVKLPAGMEVAPVPSSPSTPSTTNSSK